ncbi:PucR family transcriptional regulator [Arthrobacter sp. 2MCAF15]|uniref:PucR family transcriptional regulator n=1 Tax=Arthrobacter sp. 2MCAF15 TaxID=3232984 RepID=UPI003F90D374
MSQETSSRAPESSLGRIVERLGSTLLSLEAGTLDASRLVRSVVLYDPLDRPALTPGALVLGLGISGSDQTVEQVRLLAADGAVALVLREPIPVGPEVAQAVAETGLVLFSLVRGASWIQVATMLTSALSIDSSNHVAPGSETSIGSDLFELANALAALLQSPVTIEDLSSRVIAFSADQAGTDEPRRRTILGLHVPEALNDAQRKNGAFRRIYTSERPVFVEKPEPEALPRVAMRVKAGEELLGSIWAVVHEPLTEQREQGMVEAARVVALTMLRARVSSDSSTRLRLGLVSMLLDGGTRAREGANQLNFSKSAACVIAIGARSEHDDAVRTESEAQRVASALNMYLQPIYPRAVASLLGRIIYAVVPLRETKRSAQDEAVQIAHAFIARMDTPSTLFAGIGSVVSEVSELNRSRTEADAALRVLRGRETSQLRVATIANVYGAALMLRLSDLLAADQMSVSGPLEALGKYDVEHNTELISTLRSWLDHFGDVSAAAEAIHVHKNTFRYRLGRLAEIGGIDMQDPEVRFGLMLELRLFP